ncbi:DUF1642 domain-containing protein [Lactococcus sp. LG1074]|uniref:DUF1642 domain-containing protein n=1 Tax=Lactococcus TaxID=1357 RepID=UPI001A8D829C|nr:DUF1642 domain-containing protein [Lactococcus sp. LG1074]QSR02677.1 DUF1642 domain-containing protein [Lactococcus sp. LG1074]
MMKKFEEEVKRPVIGIEQSSIKPSLGKAIEFYTGKVKEYHNAFNEMNKYIDGLEAQLDYYKKDKRFEVMAEEILSLKSQLAKQQPEIPEFVATEIERLKNDGAKTLSELYSADIKWLTYGTTYLNGNDLKLAEWFYDNTETFELAFIYGYTVAKEKRYEVVFLEDDTTRQILMENNAGYHFIEEEDENYGYWKQDFTEMEIKAVNEKYWAFAVPVEEEV